MPGQRLGYVRVSTLDQNPERQLDQVPVDRLFTEQVSGKDTRRLALDTLLVFVRDSFGSQYGSSRPQSRRYINCGISLRSSAARRAHCIIIAHGTDRKWLPANLMWCGPGVSEVLYNAGSVPIPRITFNLAKNDEEPEHTLPLAA